MGSRAVGGDDGVLEEGTGGAGGRGRRVRQASIQHAFGGTDLADGFGDFECSGGGGWCRARAFCKVGIGEIWVGSGVELEVDASDDVAVALRCC